MDPAARPDPSRQGAAMRPLDRLGRRLHDLRISVTDRCNLRCVYCMPPEGVALCSHSDILTYEEIETIVRAAAGLGISKVRLTGGEPLVRLRIVDLVRMLAQVPGVDDLSMTTNGTLLARYAQDLADAGLRRVNVSLDTLRLERFQTITRRGRLEDALAGIEAALRAGLQPVKINAVIIRGLNDDEVLDLALKSVDEGWNVRFIEWMPVGDETMPGVVVPGAHGDRWAPDGWRAQVVTAAEMRAWIEATLGALAPVKADVGGGPARYYRLPGARGTIGFITAVSEHFCYQCNRLRLTADGQLRPCLLSDQEIDLRTPLRQGAGIDQVQGLLLAAIERKPRRHHLDERLEARDRVMSQIGG
jgi:cyclic pyranopterin phosphate synthase